MLANGKIIEAKNLAPEPENAFEIPPEVMIMEGVVGTWHTHVKGDSNLSAEDYVGFLQWPNLTHWIVSREGVRGYVIEDGVVLNL